MSDLNSVALTGRIAGEPKLIERGTLKVARLRLSVETLRRDRASGELAPRIHHFNVAVFGAPAADAARLGTGTHVSVRGQLTHSTFRDRDGAERESVEVTTAEWVRPLETTGGKLPKTTSPATADARSLASPRPRQPAQDMLDW